MLEACLLLWKRKDEVVREMESAEDINAGADQLQARLKSSFRWQQQPISRSTKISAISSPVQRIKHLFLCA
jgi:hypothetical protein